MLIGIHPLYLVVCVMQYHFVVSMTTHEQCACLIGPIRNIYSSPGKPYREQIGVLITGECLPVAHAYEDSDWLSVNFRKNILFHQLTLVGFIEKDDNIVFRNCDGSSGLFILTTSEPSTTRSAAPLTSKSPIIRTTKMAQSTVDSSITTKVEILTDVRTSMLSETTKSPIKTTPESRINSTIVRDSTTAFKTSTVNTSSTMPSPGFSTDTAPAIDTTISPIHITSAETTGASSSSTTSFGTDLVSDFITSPVSHINGISSKSTEGSSGISTLGIPTDMTSGTNTTPPTSSLNTPSESHASTANGLVTDTTIALEISTVNAINTIVTSKQTTNSSGFNDRTSVASDPTSISVPFHETTISVNTSSRPSVKTTVTTPGTTPGVSLITTDFPIGNDPCNHLHCVHGSTCVADPSPHCSCEHFRHGEHCELCGDSQCVNGNCLLIQGRQQCVCSNGFTGQLCDQIHTCSDAEISVGGECYHLSFAYETCKTNLCSNYSHTDCLVNSFGIYCLCSDTFDPLAQSPCGCPEGFIKRLDGVCVETDCRGVTSCQHGSCYFKSFYSYGCLCDEGWKGENCDIADQTCGSNHCHNNGTCVEDLSPQCACSGAWTGTNCTECGKHQCEHGACLLDSSNEPRCVCDKEYIGPNCDIVSECKGQTFGGHCYYGGSDPFTQCAENVCPPGEDCVVALHTYSNDIYCICNENVTLSFLLSECGCPERTLKNLQGECIHLLL